MRMLTPRFILLWSCVFLASHGLGNFTNSNNNSSSSNNKDSNTSTHSNVFGSQRDSTNEGDGNTLASRGHNLEDMATSNVSDNPARTDDQMDEDWLGHFLPWVVSIIVLGFLGHIGNLLTICVWTRLKDFSPTIFLFIVLAVSDSFFILFVQFLNFHLVFLTPSYVLDWVYQGVVYLSYVFQYQSVFTTVLISTIRYMAVKFPLKINIWMRKSQAPRFVMLTATLSLLVAIPSSLVGCIYLYDVLPHGPINQINTTGQNDSTRPQQYYATTEVVHRLTQNMSDVSEMLINGPGNVDQNESTTESSLYLDSEEFYPKIEVCEPVTPEYQIFAYSVTSLFLYIIPWIIAVPINFLLIYEVRKSFAKRAEMQSLEQQENRALDLIITISTTVSIVAYPVMFLLYSLTNKEDLEYYFQVPPPIDVPRSVSEDILSVQEILVTINSSLNFITYYACGKRFRTILHEDVFPFRHCKAAKESSQTSSQSSGGVQASAAASLTRTTSGQ